MKKCFVLAVLVMLSACGTIGIGSNHETRLYNNSNSPITVSADTGVYRVKPNQDIIVYSNNDLTVKSANTDCPETKVLRQLNTPAVILDVLPIGWLFGILPVFIDAVSNNMYRMPHSYSYTCAE